MQFLVRERPGEADKQLELAGVDWIFNAWGGDKGGLYKPWDNDQKVGKGPLAIVIESLQSYSCRDYYSGTSLTFTKTACHDTSASKS